MKVLVKADSDTYIKINEEEIENLMKLEIIRDVRNIGRTLVKVEFHVLDKDIKFE